jgi:biopolymer transport protein ExbD
MRLPQQTDDGDGPNLTPVIDIVFLLLIFFLVSTRYQDADEERRLEDIELPSAAMAQPASMTPQLVINITEDGRFVIERREYTEDELGAVIAEAVRNNPGQSALIYGDGDSALKHAVRATGLCNKVGMESQIAVLQQRS